MNKPFAQFFIDTSTEESRRKSIEKLENFKEIWLCDEGYIFKEVISKETSTGYYLDLFISGFWLVV